MAKILRKSQGSVSKIICFCWPKIDITLVLLYQNDKDATQSRVKKMDKESLTNF